MAAAGKVFPQSNRQDFASRHPTGEYAIPPRNWWMIFGGLAGGALMAKWAGFAGRSELNEWVDTKLHWRINHPSITTDDPHWIVEWTLVWNGLTSPVAAYVATMRFSYHEAGVEWGYYPMGTSAWGNFLDAGGLFVFQSGTWVVTTPAQFANGGTNPFQSLRRGLWSQNTDFHPYRTRP